MEGKDSVNTCWYRWQFGGAIIPELPILLAFRGIVSVFSYTLKSMLQ
jgi:hypothetical protein